LIMWTNTCFSGGKASSAMEIVRTYVTAVQARIQMCSEGQISSR
jgi:hypothetical protein